MISDHVFAECHIDTLLASLITGQKANHKRTNAQLAQAMQPFSPKRTAIGFTDRDKKLREVPYLPEFTEELGKWKTANGNISLMKHPDKPHYMVFSQPDADYVVADLINDHTTANITVNRIKSAKRTITEESEFKSLVNTIIQKPISPLSELKTKIRELLGQ